MCPGYPSIQYLTVARALSTTLCMVCTELPNETYGSGQAHALKQKALLCACRKCLCFTQANTIAYIVLDAIWPLPNLPPHDLTETSASHYQDIHIFSRFLSLIPALCTNIFHLVPIYRPSFPHRHSFLIQLYAFALFVAKTFPALRPLIPE